ncbi:hypothetical protein [Vibrio phage JSF12]|nr:hypothetical protein AVV29_gp136 [Vibrio phage phi 3]YP_009794704.1 hypothetical protein HOS35_gp021 [Vibrio phage JSF12]AJF40842.1 hypothetical protein SBVP3_0075 [Vibrio phage phi 3]ASV43539.1 hypothetical protein [Vibrio phage JSF12]
MTGKKLSARTRKIEGSFGFTLLEARRAGLTKVLGLLSKATDGYVSKHPRAVEYTASVFGL